MKRTEPFVVCSSDKEELDSNICVLRARLFNDWLTRSGFAHGACSTVNHGRREMSEVVLVREGTPEFDRLSTYVLGELEQASMIVVGCDSSAVYHWCDGLKEYAGRWKSAGHDEPEGDYTYRAGQYYVIEERAYVY